MATLSTHVLDAVTGNPARGVEVSVTVRADDAASEAIVGAGRTNDDGRVPDLAPDGLAPSTYRITFATGDWFQAQGIQGFYPEVAITFLVDTDRHYHVPVLLSPFAFSTYRGS
ncbi:hydroxyisourate hydrolase [Demetria terragena]|uniref:hydroxyisourate hydrolase n=1 Tax=Demetria terragena TaxID=63959 RepID=UPI0003826904|nr:hydroxyisourate hydrolase [Demetria terragena]